MRVKHSARWMDAVLFLWSLALLYTVNAVQDCGDDYVTINMENDCTNSSCIGECHDSKTCCLERCFKGDQPTDQELKDCDSGSDSLGTCSNFENQTECLARNTNKTFAVCWKHVVFFILSHPNVDSIKGFNPTNCPCEYEYVRKPGPCDLPQCVNSSICKAKEDQVLNMDVCCISNSVFPQEKDCDDNERLDRSVHEYLNVSTVVQCQEVCQGGPCKMPNASRLPACCKRVPKIAENSDDGSLHESIIALIVVIIVILILVGGFGVFYIYRIKQDENQFKSRFNSDKNTIEITGLDEINEDSDIAGQIPECYQVPDEHDHVSDPDFSARVYSIDKLQNGNAHAYDNRTSTDNDEQFGDPVSSQSFRRRTGSSVSNELGFKEDNVDYVFDDGHSDDEDYNGY